MKKLISLALILAILSTMAFAARIVGDPNGVDPEDFNPATAAAKVNISVDAGDVKHKYAVDVEYTDISLQLTGSSLVWDVNKLEYVTDGTGHTGMADASTDVKIKNYSDLSIFVTPTITDNDPADGIKVTSTVNARTEVAKATPATAKDAGNGVATPLDITISVTADGKTWQEVADYYTPKLTGNTNSIIAATVTIQISKA